MRIATLADKISAEQEMPLDARWSARSLFEQLVETAARYPEREAIAFQLQGGARSRVHVMRWAEVHREVTRLANLLRSLGVGEGDAVAAILPNGLEAPLVLLAGATVGVVAPINPLLSPAHIAGILREVRAKVVVTLAPFPKTDLAERIAEAVALAPDVGVVLEVDLGRYLPAPVGWALRFLRRRPALPNRARVLDLWQEMGRHRSDRLEFPDIPGDRVCACFHTGGTTGLPKVARHRARGILYNGWCGHAYVFGAEDVLLCPLPMFHVLAAYPIFMSSLVSGAKIVFPTPQGFRGPGVIRNFWRLVARHRATFFVTVPTATAALVQQSVDADISSLRLVISGSAPMPLELFTRFESLTGGVRIIEGYGMTEATCLVSVNPYDGERKVGSVGFAMAYTDVVARRFQGSVWQDCGVDEVGEICVRGPGVCPDIYTEQEKNRGILTTDGFLRTGDLGRLDADGYIWITGRTKDLIIRSGHNIDPAQIEEALMRHPDVAFPGAIGQPDARAGEVPAVYVELRQGGAATVADLLATARDCISEPAAVPKYLEILPELPKTAVGKIFKPDLRRRAITRVFDEALHGAGLDVRVAEVVEDRQRGLVALLAPVSGARADPAAVARALEAFTTPWDWA